MMRALRSTLHTGPYEPPVTTVALEGDAIDTLESITHQYLVPGGLVIHEIIEFDDTGDAEGDIKRATLIATQRQAANAEQEAHQAMLYYWSVARWGLLKERGVMFMDKPTPLSREEIEVVFAQLAQHPDYRSFTIVSHTRTGEPVELIDGKLKEG